MVGPARKREAVMGVLERLVMERGAPGHLRSDNGPQPVAKGAYGADFHSHA